MSFDCHAHDAVKVYMACRREEAYKDAVRRLEEAGLGDGTVHWLKLDLSDPRLAIKAAEELLKREDRLDILSKCSI
jgi:NAD(P)-dependent dehydrogenase (short-subunit alcohol dehydrogenase family)